MRGKKGVVIGLLTCVLLGLCGCNKMKESNSNIFISVEEFMEYTGTSVDITPENWREYFDVVRSEVIEEKFSSGNDEVRYVVLQLKKDCIVAGDGATLMLKGVRNINTTYTNVVSGEAFPVSNQAEFEMEAVLEETPLKVSLYPAWRDSGRIIPYDPDGDPYYIDENGYQRTDPAKKCYYYFDTELLSLECSAASGKVVVLDIPEHVWNVEEGEVRYLCVGTAEDYFRLYELTFQDDYRRFLEQMEE